MDVNDFAALLAARLAAIVPAGFRVELAGDMLWFRSDEGRFPGQSGDYRAGSRGIWPQEDFTTCTEHNGTTEECAADVARHALDALQDYIAEAIHEPWPGQRAMPEPRAEVRDSVLHLWYGDAGNAVLACEPIPLAVPGGRLELRPAVSDWRLSRNSPSVRGVILTCDEYGDSQRRQRRSRCWLAAAPLRHSKPAQAKAGHPQGR